MTRRKLNGMRCIPKYPLMRYGKGYKGRQRASCYWIVIVPPSYTVGMVFAISISGAVFHE